MASSAFEESLGAFAAAVVVSATWFAEISFAEHRREEASAVVVHAAGEKDERGVEGEYRLGEDETRRGASIAGRGTGDPRR